MSNSCFIDESPQEILSVTFDNYEYQNKINNLTEKLQLKTEELQSKDRELHQERRKRDKVEGMLSIWTKLQGPGAPPSLTHIRKNPFVVSKHLIWWNRFLFKKGGNVCLKIK